MSLDSRGKDCPFWRNALERCHPSQKLINQTESWRNALWMSERTAVLAQCLLNSEPKDRLSTHTTEVTKRILPQGQTTILRETNACVQTPGAMPSRLYDA
jgi:hypothetical protein